MLAAPVHAEMLQLLGRDARRWHCCKCCMGQACNLSCSVSRSTRWSATLLQVHGDLPISIYRALGSGCHPPACFFANCLQYVRDWVKKRTGFDSDFKVTFYPGRYAPEKCSILPVGDPTQYIPEHEVSGCSHAWTEGKGGNVPACSGA